MHIRKLRKADARILQDRRLFALRESPESFLVSLSEVEGTPITAVEHELVDPSICYFGAFKDDQLVGFMRYVRPDRVSRRHTAEVRSVYVMKAMRGQGIGKHLLLSLIGDAKDRGLKTLHLSVLADNAAARQLYEACGFISFGTEPRAIKKNDQYIDQVHYWKPLTAI